LIVVGILPSPFEPESKAQSSSAPVVIGADTPMTAQQGLQYARTVSDLVAVHAYGSTEGCLRMHPADVSQCAVSNAYMRTKYRNGQPLEGAPVLHISVQVHPVSTDRFSFHTAVQFVATSNDDGAQATTGYQLTTDHRDRPSASARHFAFRTCEETSYVSQNYGESESSRLVCGVWHRPLPDVEALSQYLSSGSPAY
jgi:hypothetical protein